MSKRPVFEWARAVATLPASRLSSSAKLLAWLLADCARLVDGACAAQHELPTASVGRWCVWRSRAELAELVGQEDARKLGSWLDALGVLVIERRKWRHEAPVLVLTLDLPAVATEGADPPPRRGGRSATSAAGGSRGPIRSDRGGRSAQTEGADRPPPLRGRSEKGSEKGSEKSESAQAREEPSAPPAATDPIPTPSAAPEAFALEPVPPKARKAQKASTSKATARDGAPKIAPGVRAKLALTAAVEAEPGARCHVRAGDVRQRLAGIERTIAALLNDPESELEDALRKSAEASVANARAKGYAPTAQWWEGDLEKWAPQRSYLPPARSQRSAAKGPARVSTNDEIEAGRNAIGGRRADYAH